MRPAYGEKYMGYPGRFYAKIENMEARVARRPTVRMVCALALRQWLVFAVADFPREKDAREYLHRAHYTVQTMLRKNESNLWLLWLAIFFSVELLHFDKANELLDNIYGYRNYLKSHQPLHYAILCYLYSYLEIKQKRNKSAKKHMNMLEGFVKDGSMGSSTPYGLLMLGMLCLASYDHNEAYSYLAGSYHGGCRSVFLMYALFVYYRTALKNPDNYSLLPHLLHWALNNDADVQDIIHVYQPELSSAFAGQSAIAEQIYHMFPDLWILREIADARIKAGDYSAEAYGYYKDAERRQVSLPMLYYFLIKSAFANGVEEAQHYTMVKYLQNPNGLGIPPVDADLPLRVFVYHLMLTYPSLSELVKEHSSEILPFAAFCLEKGIRSRYANSLYYFFWSTCKEIGISGKNVEKAEELLFEDYKKFEVTNLTARYLYVTERERRGMLEYIVPEDGRPCVITAVSADFRGVCLGEGRKEIINEKPVVKRMVAQAGELLYRHACEKGANDFETIAFLAKTYMETDGEQDDEILTETECQFRASVYEKALASKEASRAFKTQVNVALGQLHYRHGRFKEALRCYANADENELDGKYLEHMLTAYTQRQEWALAAGLAQRKSHRVSDRVLFHALKKLAKPEQAAWHPQIAAAAYGLQLRSWYDADLLKVVLDHHACTQDSWLALARALSAFSVREPRLDAIIIENAVHNRSIDEHTQRVFTRISETPGELQQECVQDFIYYCAFEMILNDACLLPETINVLENAFINGDYDDPVLAVGLCHFYFNHQFAGSAGSFSALSAKVLEAAVNAQKEGGYLFPVFKMISGGRSGGIGSVIRDKISSCAYIEKFRPFLYRTLPNKNVRVYYRVNDETDWRSIPMRYWRFGLYLAQVPHFYNERITYYFSEELPTGSIITREKEVHNTLMYVEEADNGDPFFVLNNAMIYERMFKYDEVERIITNLAKDVRPVRAGLIK